MNKLATIITVRCFVLFLFSVFLILNLQAQNVGVNSTGANPDESAILDVDAAPENNKGFLIPRLTTAQRDAIGSPAEGLQIYNLDCHNINYFNGSVWVPLNSIGGTSPATPGVITGNTTPCVNEVGATYSIAAVTGATNYNWVVPADATITAGQGTVAITITYGTTSGDVCVTANNACGISDAACTAITIAAAPTVANAGSDQSACSSTATLAGNTPTVGSGTWTLVSGSGTITTPSSATSGITNLGAGDNVFRWTITNGSCPPSTDDVTITRMTAANTAVVSVTNTYTGKVWMDRNLGASQAATAYNDAAAYGCLYQWGRADEGHESRTSTTYSTNATTALPSLGNAWDGMFITETSPPNDWLDSQDDNLWQGASGTNNPCPSGYRIPTEPELNAERLSWVQSPISSTNDRNGAYASPLKLPSGGYRLNGGGLDNVGTSGLYWTSAVSGSNAIRLGFTGSGASMNTSSRVRGRSVRCIKD